MKPQATYLPVVSYGTADEFRYWTKKCLIFYNNLLVSPFTTGRDKKRKHFGKGCTIYADSGGYQAITMNKKLGARNVLRWQERISNVSFTLDIPPHYFGKDYTKQEFQKCMYQSNKNANLMMRCKVNDDMQLWGVIQGRTYDECKIWYKDLTKDYNFDGYSISLSIHKSGAEIPWIEQLRFAKTVPKRFHFLGFSDQLFTLVLAQLAKKTNLCYTFDSSTPNIGGRYGKYIHPETGVHLHITQDHTIKNLPCSCPVCKNHTLDDLRRETQLINLHNLFVKIKFCELANSLTDEQFYSYLDKIVGNKTHKSQIIELLDV